MSTLHNHTRYMDGCVFNDDELTRIADDVVAKQTELVALRVTTNDALNVEHEIQRLMLERLGLEWTPGEPFYSIIEMEIGRLSHVLAESEAENERLEEQANRMAGTLVVCTEEIERLRAALEKIAAAGNIHPSWLIEDAKAALGGQALASNGPDDHEERCYLAGYGES